MTKSKKKSKKKYFQWIAYVPDDGHWDIPGIHSDKEGARKAFLKMLELKRCPAGTFIFQKEGYRRENAKWLRTEGRKYGSSKFN